MSEHTRAYIKIQDGCNQFCSYCIIPYARGRIRSREPEEILSEVSTLAASGYREIVLTGIHISSYGKDFGREDALISLVEKLASIEGVDRIRFGSLEPGIITEDFVQRLAAIKQICPHFHLSLQSGCEATLKRMNRHYTPEDYAARCGILEKYFDRPAFTTDVIVGFPGETENEFVQTEKFLEKIHLPKCIYSNILHAKGRGRPRCRTRSMNGKRRCEAADCSNWLKKCRKIIRKNAGIRYWRSFWKKELSQTANGYGQVIVKNI